MGHMKGEVMLEKIKTFMEGEVFDPFDIVRYEYDIKKDPDHDPKSHFSNSRSLHTSFKSKMYDTFLVLSGDQHRFGLIDYATLGAFRLLYVGNIFFTDITAQVVPSDASFLKKAALHASIIPYILCGAGNLITNYVIRYPVSALFTLLLSPVVGIAHLITNAVRYFKVRSLLKLLDKEKSKNTENADTIGQLKAFFKKTSMNKIKVQCGAKKERIVFFNKKNPTEMISVTATMWTENRILQEKLIEVSKSARAYFWNCQVRHRS